MKWKGLEIRGEEGEGFEIRIKESFTKTSPKNHMVEIGRVDLYSSGEQQ